MAPPSGFILLSSLMLLCGTPSRADDFVALIDVHPAYEQDGAVAGRILFVNLETLKIQAQLPTSGVPCVSAGPAPGTFLVAHEEKVEGGGRRTVVVEFDPGRRKVLGRYEHPRPLASNFTAYGFHRQLSRIQAGPGRLWLVTEDLSRPGHAQQRVEAVDWSPRKTAFHYDVPEADWNRVFAFALGSECVLLRDTDNVGTKTEALVLSVDGGRKPLDLGLGVRDGVGAVSVSGDRLLGLTVRSGKLFGAELKGGEAVALPVRKLLDPARETRGAFFIQSLAPDRAVAGLGPIVAGIDRVVIFDPASGKVESEKDLPEPAAGLVCRPGRIYAVNARRSTVTAYDFELKVKGESEPLLVPKAVVPSNR